MKNSIHSLRLVLAFFLLFSLLLLTKELVNALQAYVAREIVNTVTWNNVERIQRMQLTTTDLPRLAYADDNSDKLFYGFCNTACHLQANWTFVEVDSAFTSAANEIAFTLDPSNNPRIAAGGAYYFCDTGCDNAVNWTKVSGVYNLLRFVGIKTTSTGAPRISHGDFASGLRYSFCDTSCDSVLNWTTINVTVGDGGAFNFLALTSDDRPRISHVFGNSDRTTQYSSCESACDNPVNWTTVGIDPSGDFYTSIALDSSNNPRVISGGGRYLVCDTACTNAVNWTIVPLGISGNLYQHLVIDFSDRPRIFKNTNVYHFCDSGCTTAGNWSSQNFVSSPTQFTMVAPDIDTSNNFHVTGITGSSSDGSIYYASLVEFMDVLTTNPDFHANAVPANTNIEVVFDDSLNPGTVDSSTVRVWGAETGNISGTISVVTTNVSNDTISFDPTVDFRQGERIYLDVTNGVESTGGLTLHHGLMNQFFVATLGGGGAPVPLTAVAVDPSGGDPEEIYAADFDADGDVDIAVANDNTLDILLNDGAGVMSLDDSILVGASSRQVVGTDIDANGSVDLVITDGDTVKVYKNDGSAAFSLFSTLSTGGSTAPYDVVAADLDADGDQDIAASGLSDNKAHILLNDGTGNLTMSVTYLFSDRLWGAISTDFENDGDTDLVFGSDSGGFIGLLTNNGDATFTSQELASVSGNQKAYAGDVDGDGDADLIVGGSSSGRLLLNDGAGNFTLDQSIDTGFSQLREPVFADYDADGDLDLGAALLGGGFRLYTNNGSGVFSLFHTLSGAGYDADGLTFADMNGDGFTDPVFVNRSPNTLSVLLNQPVPTLTVDSITPAQHAVGIAASSDITIVFSDTLDTGTVNQTNLTVYGKWSGLVPGAYSFSTTNVLDDTVTFNPTGDFEVGESVIVAISDNVLSSGATPATPFVSRFWVLGGGTGSFSPKVDYALSSDPGPLVTGDFNNDGDLDLIADLSTSAQVLLGNGDGTFTLGASLAHAATFNFRMVAGDFNRDGNMDLARPQNAGVTVYLGNGDGTFQLGTNYATTYSVKSTYISDMNGDAVLDLMAGTFDDGFPGNGAVVVFMGNGNGTFQAAVEYSFAPGGSYNLAVMDYDNDGFTDVIAPNYWDNDLLLYHGNGDGTLTNVGSFDTGNTTQSVEGGPLNSDAFVDLVDSVNGSFERRLGDGTGAFSSAASVGQPRGNFELADIDGDGDIDLLISDHNSAFVWARRNNGSATFTSTSLTTDQRTLDVTSGDFDHDGSLDIVTSVFTGGSEVSVFLGAAANLAPAATTPTAIAQATDGSGHISFQTTVSDPDSDTTRLKVEYSDNGGVNYYDAELVSATPSAGTVDLNNAATYQIGSTNAIDTDSGAKTLTIVWDSKSASNGNGVLTGEQNDIRLRVTPNDVTVDGTAQSTGNFAVDNQAPTGLTALNNGTSTSTTQALSWNAVTETNFNHYEIWYGTNQSDVVNRTGTATEWDDSNDAALATRTTTNTTITGLSPATSYFYKIFAVDNFGNEETVADINDSTFSSGGGGGRIPPQEPPPEPPTEPEPEPEPEPTIPPVETPHPAPGEPTTPVFPFIPLGLINALQELFQWMNPLDYQLTNRRAEVDARHFQFILRMKQTLKALAVASGYSDGYGFNKPEKEPMENVAELIKVIMITFSDCYTPSELQRAIAHDRLDNPGYWWAGYWHFLDPLMQRFFGPGYVLWQPIDRLRMLDVLEIFLTDYCHQDYPS